MIAAGAIMTINARDGGTDANDWAEMLLRMYTLWAQTATITRWPCWTATTMTKRESTAPRSPVRGPMAYGYLRAKPDPSPGADQPVQCRRESGRPVLRRSMCHRRSPTTRIRDQRRDVRVDTYRASGAGGQHVNKTDSAIRLDACPFGNRGAMPE